MKTIACFALATSMLLLVPCGADAQAEETHARALDITKRLAGTEPQFFAAAVPDQESRFVAVMHIPRLQLLVISGRYPAPALLRELLFKGDFQRVYLDLNAAAEREGRFFVEDLGADGMRPDREPNAAFDITWRDGTVRTMYNGDWAAQQLTKSEYHDRFEKDAEDYAEILQLLLQAHAARMTAQP